MTPEQYWDEDADLAIFYRKKDMLRAEQDNWRAYLIGAYTYEAVLDASPLMNPFAPKGTKAVPYPKKPYELGFEAVPEEEPEQVKNPDSVVKTEAEYEHMMAKLQNMVAAVNKGFSEKHSKERGNGPDQMTTEVEGG